MRKTKLEQALEEAAEVEKNPDRVVRSDVKVTRGHDRTRVLQIRLNEDEYAKLERLAKDQSVPVSTLARSYLLRELQGSRGSTGPSVIDTPDRDAVLNSITISVLLDLLRSVSDVAEIEIPVGNPPSPEQGSRLEYTLRQLEAQRSR